MAGVEEVRQGITLANEKLRDGLGALQQAREAIEEAGNHLRTATQGTNQLEMQQAHGAVIEAMSNIDGIVDTLNYTITANDGYVSRL